MNGQPCYAGVKCIDLPPPANVSGYTCGPCPTGYTGNGAQCAEIDECQSDQANNCEQICVNVPGSFFCDCREGYKLSVNEHSCEDVNECEPTSDCMQKCVNTLGSYKCSCDQYFETDPKDWKNCIVTNPCSSDHGCHHICFKGNDNQATCSCFANYELESDSKTCKDINECDPGKPLHLCNQICENTLGSYRCSCEKGFELNKNGYDCEDINECVDEDLFECTDEFHKCVNTRGSYKCECGQNLYFIDGKCRGLAKNETTPTPSLPPTRVPSVIEREQAVRISVDAGGKFNWDFKTDESFKDKMASVTSTFCVENRTACALKDTRLQRRALPLALYTAEQVHLLPGYPEYLSSSLLVAFYVQQPLGLFIGNTSALPESALLAIVVRYKSELETAIGVDITDVQRLFYPTTLPTPSVVPVEEDSFNKWKWIAIGVSAGVFFIILALVITFVCVKNKGTSIVKPFSIDGPDEPIGMESMDSLSTANRKVSF